MRLLRHCVAICLTVILVNAPRDTFGSDPEFETCRSMPGIACADSQARNWIDAAPQTDSWDVARMQYAVAAAASGRAAEALEVASGITNPQVAVFAYLNVARALAGSEPDTAEIPRALEQLAGLAHGLDERMSLIVRHADRIRRNLQENGHIGHQPDDLDPIGWFLVLRPAALTGQLGAAVDTARSIPAPIKRAAALLSLVPHAGLQHGRARANAVLREAARALRDAEPTDWLDRGHQTTWLATRLIQTVALAGRSRDLTNVLQDLQPYANRQQTLPHVAGAHMRHGRGGHARRVAGKLSGEDRAYAQVLIARHIDDPDQRRRTLEDAFRAVGDGPKAGLAATYATMVWLYRMPWPTL
jgi:hypothetical protein